MLLGDGIPDPFTASFPSQSGRPARDIISAPEVNNMAAGVTNHGFVFNGCLTADGEGFPRGDVERKHR